jgi:signal transduction histidine kinase
MPTTKTYCAVLFHSLLLSVVSLVSTAQSPIEIKNLDKEEHRFILDEISILTDTSRQEDKNFIISDSASWHPIHQKTFISLGASTSKFWLRFSLVNSDRVDHEPMLVLANHVIRELELFVNKNGELYSLGETGADYPFNSRPYPFLVFVYPLKIEPGAVKNYYLRINNKGSASQFSLILFSKRELHEREMRIYSTFGLFAGIVLIVSLFNLFLFFVIREKIHLLYFFYSLSVIWILMSLEGLDFQFIYPGHAAYYIPGRACSLFLSIGTLLFVMQSFLRQTAANSYVYKPVAFLKWFCLCLSGIAASIVISDSLHSFIGTVYHLFYTITPIVAVALILISCIEKIKQGYRLAIFYLVAVSVFLAGMLFSVLTVMGLINVLPMPPTVLEAGLVIEAVIISFGILYRYNFFKKEKEALAKQLLEQKLNVGRQILQAQESEQKRIAADLHDELGGNLAALKMTLQSFHLPGNQASTLNKLVDTASTNARHIAHNLMPPEFENTSLQELLDKFYLRLNAEGKINFRFYSTESKYHFNKQDELMIYRVIMELTNNIIKHAEATEASIQLIYYDTHLELMAEDNGKGFVEEKSDGIGLKTVRSRIEYLQGKLNIDSTNRGTTVMIQVPYNT